MGLALLLLLDRTPVHLPPPPCTALHRTRDRRALLEHQEIWRKCFCLRLSATRSPRSLPLCSTGAAHRPSFDRVPPANPASGRSAVVHPRTCATDSAPPEYLARWPCRPAWCRAPCVFQTLSLIHISEPTR